MFRGGTSYMRLINMIVLIFIFLSAKLELYTYEIQSTIFIVCIQKKISSSDKVDRLKSINVNRAQ